MATQQAERPEQEASRHLQDPPVPAAAPGTASGERGSPGERLKRGGLLAGVAALVAGVLTKVTATPARADDGGPLLLGQENTETGTTILPRTNSAGVL